MKIIDSLQIEDLRANPLWRYGGSDSEGQILVRPVKSFPVSDLKNKVVGTQVKLANGDRIWALIGNVDSDNPVMTRHFLTLSVLQDGIWFGLARYHDFNHAQRGPEPLAKFLHLDLDEVFPIEYDLRPFSRGNPEALSGVIFSEPRERLSKNQLMNLVISDLKV